MEKMLKKRLVKNGLVARYEVEGNVDHLNDQEILDFCDLNNWGGMVYRHENGAMVEVYID
jgi:hypothetical protein